MGALPGEQGLWSPLIHEPSEQPDHDKAPAKPEKAKPDRKERPVDLRAVARHCKVIELNTR